MNEERTVLCGANSYEEKYYFNEEFDAIPQGVKDELKIMCVLFTEDCGGILTLEFEKDGTLLFCTRADDYDYLYDEIETGDCRRKNANFWSHWSFITGSLCLEKMNEIHWQNDDREASCRVPGGARSDGGRDRQCIP